MTILTVKLHLESSVSSLIHRYNIIIPFVKFNKQNTFQGNPHDKYLPVVSSLLTMPLARIPLGISSLDDAFKAVCAALGFGDGEGGGSSWLIFT